MKTENQPDHTVVSFLKKENRKLIRYINNYLDDRLYGIEAEDILQEVALNLYARADLSGPVGNVAAYIYRSVRNKIIDLYRKKKWYVSMERISGPAGEIPLHTLPESEQEGPPVYQDEAMQQKLMLAIKRLSPAEQELIWKTDFEDYTFKDLADEWEIPVGTLLARKHRALGKLRKMLQEEHIMSNHKNK